MAALRTSESRPRSGRWSLASQRVERRRDGLRNVRLDVPVVEMVESFGLYGGIREFCCPGKNIRVAVWRSIR